MRMLRTVVGLAFIVAVTPAFAQDLAVSGVVSVDLSAQTTHYEGKGAYWWSSDSQTTVFTLDGKLGVAISPEFSVQFDAWAQNFDGYIKGNDNGGPYEYGWQQQNAGVAVHGAVHIDNFYVGAAVGGGGYKYGADQKGFVTAGVEAGMHADTYSIAAQLGYTGAVTPNARADRDNMVFGGLAATYYLTPDLAITASGLYEHVTYDEGLRAAVVRTEARYKLEDKPLILSLTYSGRHGSYTSASTEFHSPTHTITAGIKIPFGAGSTSLQALDRAAGLDLHHGFYGKNSYR